MTDGFAVLCERHLTVEQLIRDEVERQVDLPGRLTTRTHACPGGPAVIENVTVTHVGTERSLAVLDEALSRALLTVQVHGPIGDPDEPTTSPRFELVISGEDARRLTTDAVREVTARFPGTSIEVGEDEGA